MGDPVNLANGNWFHTSPDLSVLTRGIKLQFIRYYNTLDPNRSSLGRGWRHSYDRSIELLPGEKLLILHLPDGEREVFEDAGGGRFLGDESKTVILRQPSRYMEHALDRTVFYYDATGRWTRAEHPSGFSVTLDRPNEWEMIIRHSDGYSLRLTYENSRLVQLEDPVGGVWRYSYDARGFMGLVEYPDGNSIRYRYNPEGFMSRYINKDGGPFQLFYDEQGRVERQLLSDGRDWRFTYNDPVVRLKDPWGGVTDYYLDEKGNIERTVRVVRPRSWWRTAALVAGVAFLYWLVQGRS